MNKLKLISMALCAMALFGFNSCLGSDDDNYRELTAEEKEEQYLMVGGSHMGKVIFPAKNETNPQDQTDTLDCRFYIGKDYDTENMKTVYTLTISKIPIKVIGNYMGYGEQRDQMLTKEDVTLNCDMDFVYIDDATIDAAWLINPYPAEMNLNYNGKDHKVQVYFFVNATNSMGAIGTVTNKDGVKKKQIQMWVTVAAIYADEKQTSWLNSYVQFYFVADVATLD